MSRLDYSKWDNIEVSDDEDDTHPNIDTPSLFRWRHQARIDREEQFLEEKKMFEESYKKYLTDLENAKQSVIKAKKSGDETNMKSLEAKLEELKVKEEEWKDKQDELAKKERLKPWNVDSICHEGKSRTIINSAETNSEAKAAETEEDAVDRLHKFVEKNEKLIKKYGMFKRPDDTMQYLVDNPQLVCEETANHLVLWCIDLAIEEKVELMNHVTHQTIVMQFMLELAKSLKIDPRACIRPFFAKFKTQEPEYMRAFNDELNSFRDRVKKRAEARIEEAMAKYEREEKEKRLGPGGLDPVEVFESLPKELQECFESKNIDLLKKSISSLPSDQAEYHMKRCVESGLWVPEQGNSASGLDEETVEELGSGDEDPYTVAKEPEIEETLD